MQHDKILMLTLASLLELSVGFIKGFIMNYLQDHMCKTVQWGPNASHELLLVSYQ